ncbi:hypothetical protein [Advenella alkanexedens]|uniref:hypothetical protein n=1 Tax=Advenella alkanexedens TaxID=1481665 RepID=UPI002676C200|nr:hypothetical protein [Advenella alkanexedens]WKU20551.1 hypothetical protein Q3V95_05950 [Advenella alkanexedens]
MSSKKKLAIATAGVLVVAAGAAWYGGNKLAQGKVEEELKAFLVQNNLQDNVFWESLEANVSGTGSMTNVKIVDKQNPAHYYTFRKVVLKDIENTEKVQKIDISFQGFADETGNSPIGKVSANRLADLGYTELPKVNGSLKVSFDSSTDRSMYEISIDQPELASFGVKLDANKIGGLLEQVRANSQAIQQNPMAVLPFLAPVSINSLSFNIDDKGLVKRVIAKEKGAALGDAPTPAQNATYEAKMLQQKEACMKQAAIVFGVNKTEASCDAIYKYVTNQKDSLSFAMNPTPPFELMSVLQLLSGAGVANANQLFQNLNIELKN